jgi:hypothetical protein
VPDERFHARLIDREYGGNAHWVWVIGAPEPHLGVLEVAADAVRVVGHDGSVVVLSLAAIVAVQSAP